MHVCIQSQAWYRVEEDVRKTPLPSPRGRRARRMTADSTARRLATQVPWSHRTIRRTSHEG